MALFKPEDLYDIGEASGDFVKGLASDVGNRVCELYQAFPRGFGVSSPGGTAVNALASGVWDSFCGRLPTPKLPSVPTPGKGKCDGVAYLYRIKCTAENGAEIILGGGFGNEPFCAYGPLSGIRIEKGFASDGTWVSSNLFAFNRGGCGGSPLPYEERLIYSTSPFVSAVYIELRRADGLPDDCDGNPEYPSALPPTQVPQTYNHVGNDGVARPINYNINFNPGFSPSIEFPDLPDLKIPVNIDATGIEVNIPVGIGNVDGKGALTDDNIENLLEGAKAALRAARSGVRGTDPGQSKPEGDEQDGIDNLYGLIFEASEIPTFFGKVFGNPVKYRLGRISFKRDGIPFEDVDILFESQYIPAPVDANGYVATYETGVVGSITVVTGEQE